MIGQVSPVEKFPQHLHHPMKPGYLVVQTKEEKEAALKDGWGDRYYHQEYPKMLHHVVKPPMIVADEEEEVRMLKQGWALSPQEFSEEAALEAKIQEEQAFMEELKEKRKKLRAMQKASAV